MKLFRIFGLAVLGLAVVALSSCDFFASLTGSAVAATSLPANTIVTSQDYTQEAYNGWDIDAASLTVNYTYAVTVGPLPAAYSVSSFDIWGSNPYTSDSSLAVAAVHAGAITSSGGTFYVSVTPGLSSYWASTANGVTTTAWGTWDKSFKIYKR